MNIGRFNIYDSNGRLLGSTADALDFGATGLSALVQCVKIILTTAIGSVTLDRGFGVDYSFVDMPQPQAQAMILANLLGPLQRLEPRVGYQSVAFVTDPATFEMTVKVAIKINSL